MYWLAYADRPLPIGHEQTISQPYIVAFMSELAALAPDARVLEVGTGCGYQTAVLAELAAEVYSIEIIEHLASRARTVLARLGYQTIYFRAGDGELRAHDRHGPETLSSRQAGALTARRAWPRPGP